MNVKRAADEAGSTGSPVALSLEGWSEPVHNRGDGHLQDTTSTPFDLKVDGATVTDRRLRNVALSTQPRLSWKAQGRADQVFTVTVRPEGGGQPLWQVSTASFWVDLGVEVAAHSHLEWEVTTDADGSSARAELLVGPLQPAEWHAAWVSAPALSTMLLPFRVDAEAVRVLIHVAVQGLAVVAVNASDVDPGSQTSTVTDAARSLYRTYDVTDLVSFGENEFSATVSSGPWAQTGAEPRLLVAVVTTYPDGTRVFAGSGSEILAVSSAVVESDQFYVEGHDVTRPRQMVPVTIGPSYAEATADALVVVVEPDPTPPIRPGATLDAVRGVWIDDAVVFDVGTNIAGRARIEIAGVPRCTVVTVVHGETVDASGRLSTTNLEMPQDRGRARQVFRFTAFGGVQAAEPMFAFYGFRYVEVTGLAAGADVTVTAVALHTDLARIGAVTTDDLHVDAFIGAAERTILNNVHGYPTDCPTREQAGWTADTGSCVASEVLTFDLNRLLRKWLGDFRAGQLESGAFPAVVPDLHPHSMPADPVWGAAFPLVLAAHWLAYGDERVVVENLSALRRWADHLLTLVAEGVIANAEISYGTDWLALDPSPVELLHTAAAIEGLDILAQLEDDAGDPLRSPARREQANALRAVARERWSDPMTGSFGNGSQGSHSFGVDASILVGPQAASAVEAIAADIIARGHRLSTGFATTRSLVSVVGASRGDVLLGALRQSEEPGVGAMLVAGPGTLWESWWRDPSNRGTGSLDHVGLAGPLLNWVWRDLGGITPVAPGFRRFVVEPHLVDGVENVTLSHATPRGALRLTLQRQGDRCRVHLIVPYGAEATVRLPGVDDRVVTAGSHQLDGDWRAAAPGVAPPTTHPWQAPAVLAPSSDVGATDDERPPGKLAALPGSTLTRRPDRLHCMPVHHAQPASPTWSVASVGQCARIRFTYTTPQPVESPGFIFALVDTCALDPRDTAELVLRAECEDGSAVTSRARIWPFGWNRVALDASALEGHGEVQAIEVAVQAQAPDVHFELGGLGASPHRRTW